MNSNAKLGNLTNLARIWLKDFPILVKTKRSAQNALAPLIHRRSIAVIEQFQQFAPNSDGSYKSRAELTALAANQTFPFLAHFVKSIKKDCLAESFVRSQDLCEDEESKCRAATLKKLFDEHGSDKAGVHDYHLVYGSRLRDPESVTAILEIGLGTNNKDVVSHMGRDGRPGASLRAFRDFCPNASIFGADVDRRILFEEDRIKTFFVDQTDLRSFEALGEGLRPAFDLIIDDGLHAPNANIATLSFALSKLKKGGWFVVEDIPERAVPVWHVVAALLPSGFCPLLVRTRAAMLFAVEKTVER